MQQVRRDVHDHRNGECRHRGNRYHQPELAPIGRSVNQRNNSPPRTCFGMDYNVTLSPLGGEIC